MMTMTILLLLVLLGITAGTILVARDWRWMLIALFINYVGQGLFLAQQQFIIPDLSLFGREFSSLVFVKLIVGLAVSAILGITALTFSREYGLEDLDEFSLAELRRAARAAQRRRSGETRKFGDYVLPIWAMLMIGLASFFLPRVLPLALQVYPTNAGLAQAVDFVWYWQALIGLTTLILATDILKVGLGLLLCFSGLDLLYTTLASGVNVLSLAGLGLVTLMLALVIAYLSGVLYGRFKTLDLAELERR